MFVDAADDLYATAAFQPQLHLLPPHAPVGDGERGLSISAARRLIFVR